VSGQPVNDVVADLLAQVTHGVEQGMRPPPTTIAALRRLNGAIAKQCAANDLKPEDYDKPLSFYIEMPARPEQGPDFA
jgi:hypothetical protein